MNQLTLFEESVIQIFLEDYPGDSYIKQKEIQSEDFIYLEIIIPSRKSLEKVLLIPSQFSPIIVEKEV